MTIPEMHVWFRQYAQQMGMQNNRAILPEQIDVFINTSISDKVNQIVRENLEVKNYRVVTDAAKLNQINALRSLYKVIELPMTGENPFMEFLKVNINTGKMSNKQQDSENNVSTTVAPDYLYLVDFSLKYKVATSGYTGTHSANQGSFDGEGIETNWFPVRLIDDAFLADTLNDFVMRNRVRSPIMVTYNNGTFDLYIENFKEMKEEESRSTYVLQNNLLPYKLRMSYLAKPAQVAYRADIGGRNDDCDLPESMHIDILKHAVDLYNTSITGSLYNNQLNQQAQQREFARNGQNPNVVA